MTRYTKCLYLMYGWMKTGGKHSSRPPGSSKDADGSEGDFEVGFVANEDPKYLMSPEFRKRWLDWLHSTVREQTTHLEHGRRVRTVSGPRRRLNFRLTNLRDIHYGIMDIAPASKRSKTATVVWNLFRVTKDVGPDNTWQPVDAVLLRQAAVPQRFALRPGLRYRPGPASSLAGKPVPRRLHTTRGWSDPVVGASVDWDNGKPEGVPKVSRGFYHAARGEDKMHLFFPDVGPGEPRFQIRESMKDDRRRLVMDRERHDKAVAPWNRHDEGILFRWKRRKEEEEWTEYPLWRKVPDASRGRRSGLSTQEDTSTSGSSLGSGVPWTR